MQTDSKGRNSPEQIPHIPEFFKDISLRKLEIGSSLCVSVCLAYMPGSRSYELFYLTFSVNVLL